jgi:site-specific DNA-methyltransferase (adenine-specific)
MAIRLAGFEIRDCIQWVYGCLSDDTEILTENGWVEYSQFHLSKKVSIFIYDKEKDEYFFETPEKWNEYKIKDTCYRIQSDYTDQIVSRNHRCVVERKGKLLFEFAENLAQERQANIPFLESLSSLSENLSNIHKRTSITKQSLWKRLFLQNNINIKNKFGKKKANRTVGNNKIGLFSMQKRIFSTQFLVKKSKNSNLFKKMQRILSGSRVEKMGENRFGNSEFTTQQNKKRKQGREKSCLERGNNLSKKERILFGSEIEICEMPNRFDFDVKKRWLYCRVSANNGKAIRKDIIENGVRTPHRPRPNKQRYNELNVIFNKQGTQTIRMGKTYSTTLATITPFEYTGVIFCPTVSTGCFVARRNGKIFITGNSGFPKSHNISKAINKMGGVEYDEIPASGVGFMKPDSEDWNVTKNQLIQKGESTEQAKQWEGWGSALKPANEPIVLARKPLEKGLSIAENVLKWGTGGLNIDVSRIGNEKRTTPIFSDDTKNDGTTFNLNSNIQHHREETTQGRFPSNFIMSHHPECECEYFKYNGEEEINENWTCVDDCPIKILDEQSGELKSGKMTANHNRTTNGSPNGIYGKFDVNHPLAETYGDKGGASRFFYVAKASQWERNYGLDNFEEKQIFGDEGETFVGLSNSKKPSKNIHPTVKPIKLMQYLIRLVTPPNGIVLDPFAGSGTTGIACKIDGFEFVGLELSEEYTEIANSRIQSFNEELLLLDETIIYKNRSDEENDTDSQQLTLF